MPKHRTSPCGSCPFSRAVKPGTLGGSHPTVCVGQSIGPFVLNCHTAEGDAHQQTDVRAVAQCAGAAIFRANLGVADRLPDAIHRQPADHELVFSSHAEFVSHHAQLELWMAESWLRVYTPQDCLQRELHDTNCREA
jgi:hypothetical protein